MKYKYKTKSEIIASLKEAIVIDSFSRAQHGYIYLSFKDAPFVEYRLKFDLYEFECNIVAERLNIVEIDEHEQVMDVVELGLECQPQMILYCFKCGLEFEIDAVMVNQTVKELWEQIESMKAYFEDALSTLNELLDEVTDEEKKPLISAMKGAIAHAKENGWKVKQDLLNLNIQS